MTKVDEKLLQIDKRYLTGREVVRLLNISPKNRRVVLSRLTKREVLRRLRRDLYEVILKPADVLEVSNIIYQPSYLSFTYCLGRLGILNQIAYEIEFATPKKTKRIEIRDRSIIFRKINRKLFFGYTLKDNIFIAEPEKALLDTLYLKSKGLTNLDLEELNLKDLSRKKFLEWSKNFPEVVQKMAKDLAKKLGTIPITIR
jgi:predicted transcriptional regulator of viral defense system